MKSLGLLHDAVAVLRILGSLVYERIAEQVLILVHTGVVAAEQPKAIQTLVLGSHLRLIQVLFHVLFFEKLLLVFQLASL